MFPGLVYVYVARNASYPTALQTPAPGDCCFCWKVRSCDMSPRRQWRKHWSPGRKWQLWQQRPAGTHCNTKPVSSVNKSQPLMSEPQTHFWHLLVTSVRKAKDTVTDHVEYPWNTSGMRDNGLEPATDLQLLQNMQLLPHSWKANWWRIAESQG